MTRPLSNHLALHTGVRTAVIGCGGKTGLIRLLARENHHLRVLCAPTAKIVLPHDADVTVLTARAACLAHTPRAGIQYMGIYDPASGKLTGLPVRDIGTLAVAYDLTLMEADGSRGLPLKGWADFEPRIPAFTDLTIGVVSIRALRLTADTEHVHRLPIFLALTGMKAGQPVSIHALQKMITAPGGLFAKARGRRILLINQADTPPLLEAAAALADKVAGTGIAERIVTGSLFSNQWRLFYER